MFSSCHNILHQLASWKFNAPNHFLLVEMCTDVDSKLRRKLDSLISLQVQHAGENVI